MDGNERRVIGRRLREAREQMGLDRPALAERLGVHTGSIARWETGGSVPIPYHMERIAEWAGVELWWLRNGAPHEAGEPGGVDAAGAADDPFPSAEAVARFVGGIGPVGEGRLRKLDALEGLRRMLTAAGPLPDWWYLLRERVERDEL